MAYSAAMFFLAIISLVSLAVGRIPSSSSSYSIPSCVYSIYIRTGSIIKGGTDSNISVQFFDSSNNSITIDNLVTWGGLMPNGHDYYEAGSLDVFSGLGYCLPNPICKLNISSDFTGPHPGWYIDYLEITSANVHVPCNQHQFTLNQWLGKDVYPYQLSTQRDDCSLVSSGVKHPHGAA